MIKPASRRTDTPACCVQSAIIITTILFATFVQAGEQYDRTTPGSTFRSLGLAIKNNDPKTFYKILIVSGIPYEEFLDMTWKGSKSTAAPYGLYSSASSRAADYFAQAKILKEVVGVDDAPRMSVRVLTVKWNEGNIYREEQFFRPKTTNTWFWLSDMYSHDRQVYGSTTPINAYLALGVAFELRLLSELCNAYSASVRGGLSSSELERLLGDRLSRFSKRERWQAWGEPQMHGKKDELDLEMLPPEAGEASVKAKVWQVDRTSGKKIGFETFVQEGKEWKWLPKPNCFWYLKKIEKPEKVQ